MQLKRLHILRWQTFCLLLFLVLAGTSLTLASFLPQTMAVDEAAKSSAIPDDSGASTAVSEMPDISMLDGIEQFSKRFHSADSEMPDISGTWTYNPTPPAPDDVNRDLIAPPQEFRVRRSTQSGVDFEYLGTSEPTANPRQLIWEPETRRFRAVTADGTTWQPREMFELSTDGNQLSVRTMTTADDAKRLAAKGGVSDKVFTERYLTEQWRRVEAPKVADDSKEALVDVVGSQSQKNEIATELGTPPTKALVPRPIGDPDMPDITGTWRVKHTEPVDSNNTFYTWEIRRVQQGEIDFLIDMPWVNETPRLPVKWSAVRQRFEGEFKDDDSDTENYTFTLQSQADGNSLLVIFNPTNESKKYVTQIWTRVLKTLATTYSPKDIQRTEAPPSESRTGNLMKGADRGAGGTTMNDEALQPSALPNTPAAKDLLKRLAAQESAAASAANEIRRLQATGSAVETIEPHQAQLKTLLQTAFELKMQLEELQVKELQARLSRLERQIGQRNELREKIIARRAAELLNPEVNWESTTTTQPASAREPSRPSDKSSDDSLTNRENSQQQMAKLLEKRAGLSTKMGNEHPEIKGLDQQIATLRTAMSDESSIPITVIYLKNAKAQEAVDMLQKLYPTRMDAIIADDRTNSLFVRGDETLIRDVEQLLEVLDAEAAPNVAPRSPAAHEAAAGNAPLQDKVSPFGGGGFLRDLGAAAGKASLQESDMGSFQGTWCFDVLQSDAWPKPIGQPTDSSGHKSEQRWIISGDRITWISLDDEQIEVSFTIDPTKTPKQIDFTFLSGPRKGMKSIGIYEPQKGNANYLWLCLTNPGTDAPRPTQVGYSTEKQQSMIGIYPVEKPDTTPISESLKRFQGDWQMTLCDSTLDGLGSSQDEVKKWTWTIRGDAILWSRNGEAWELKIDVDPAKTPGELDLTYLTGPHKGSKCLGMYEWGGVAQSRLLIAIQDPGSDAPRPIKFSMNSDIKTGLMILERRSSNR